VGERKWDFQVTTEHPPFANGSSEARAEHRLQLRGTAMRRRAKGEKGRPSTGGARPATPTIHVWRTLLKSVGQRRNTLTELGRDGR